VYRGTKKENGRAPIVIGKEKNARYVKRMRTGEAKDTNGKLIPAGDGTTK